MTATIASPFFILVCWVSGTLAQCVFRRKEVDIREKLTHGVFRSKKRGEWHTFPLMGLVPDDSKDKIAAAYRNSFNKTKLQARYPDSQLDGFGYYDGSFAYSTLDGDANGGVVHKDYFFWPLVEQEGHQSFWRTSPMGGETRPVRSVSSRPFCRGF
jgi:hypothetical protein